MAEVGGKNFVGQPGPGKGNGVKHQKKEVELLEILEYIGIKCSGGPQNCFGSRVEAIEELRDPLGPLDLWTKIASGRDGSKKALFYRFYRETGYNMA